jgi:hypothetical protein
MSMFDKPRTTIKFKRGILQRFWLLNFYKLHLTLESDFHCGLAGVEAYALCGLNISLRSQACTNTYILAKCIHTQGGVARRCKALCAFACRVARDEI